MKAREIKKMMLEDYSDSIKEYEETIVMFQRRIKTEEARIKHIEYQLSNFFNVNKKYNIETKEVEDAPTVPF